MAESDAGPVALVAVLTPCLCKTKCLSKPLFAVRVQGLVATYRKERLTETFRLTREPLRGAEQGTTARSCRAGRVRGGAPGRTKTFPHPPSHQHLSRKLGGCGKVLAHKRTGARVRAKTGAGTGIGTSASSGPLPVPLPSDSRKRPIRLPLLNAYVSKNLPLASVR